MNLRIEDLTGATLVADSGIKYKLLKQAGYGSQGVVYEDVSGQNMIKLYYPSGCKSIDEDIHERILFIKNINLPKNFVKVVDTIRSPYVGYVMERIVDHKPLNTYLIPEKDMTLSEWYNKGLGLYERIFIGYIIAKAFSDLERSNFSYCDISGNNILIKSSEKSASVKMIDVDNIYTAGKRKSSILGTPRYIAPEVISKQKNPDVFSDNYSLAVILFELLRVGHPYISDEILDGTPEDEENALAGNAEYVIDANSTNMLPADIVLTDKLKGLFERCFIEGKKNRLRRPSAKEFEYALLEASNKLIQCPKCGSWHYPRKVGRAYACCPWCDAESKPTAMLNFYDVLLNGSDYKTGTVVGDNKSGKLVNTYILKRNRKNFIKGLYILKYDDTRQGFSFADNYITIASDSKGFHVYNEFSKSGIVIKEYATKQYISVPNKQEKLLNSGDEIYFEVNNSAIEIKSSGKTYSFIKMARFMEDKA